MYLRTVSLDVNFNESLTNNVVSFEQQGPSHNPELIANLSCLFVSILLAASAVEKYAMFFLLYIYSSPESIRLIGEIMVKACVHCPSVHQHFQMTSPLKPILTIFYI